MDDRNHKVLHFGPFSCAFACGYDAGLWGEPVDRCPYEGCGSMVANLATAWKEGWKLGNDGREAIGGSKHSYRIAYRDDGQVSFYRQTVGRGKKARVLFSPLTRARRYASRSMAERLVVKLQRRLPVLRGHLFIQEVGR